MTVRISFVNLYLLSSLGTLVKHVVKEDGLSWVDCLYIQALYHVLLLEGCDWVHESRRGNNHVRIICLSVLLRLRFGLFRIVLWSVLAVKLRVPFTASVLMALFV